MPVVSLPALFSLSKFSAYFFGIHAHGNYSQRPLTDFEMTLILHRQNKRVLVHLTNCFEHRMGGKTTFTLVNIFRAVIPDTGEVSLEGH